MKSATSSREIIAPPGGSASPSTRYLPAARKLVSIGGITIVQSTSVADSVS